MNGIGWKYEPKRYPQTLTEIKAWGDNEDYPVWERYSATMIIGVAGFTFAMVLTMIGKCLRHRSK